MAKKWYLPDGTVTEVYQPGAVSSISDLTNPTARTTAEQLEASLQPETQPKPPVPQPGVTAGIPKPTFAPEVGGSLRNLLLRLYPERIQPALARGLKVDDLEDDFLKQIQDDMTKTPDAFLQTLASKRSPNESRALLDYLGIPSDITDKVVGVQQTERQIQLTMDNIPELGGMNLDSLNNLLQTDPQGLLQLLRQSGGTDKYKLLLDLGIPRDQVAQLLAATPTQKQPTGWNKVAYATFDAVVKGLNFINTPFRKSGEEIFSTGADPKQKENFKLTEQMVDEFVKRLESEGLDPVKGANTERGKQIAKELEDKYRGKGWLQFAEIARTAPERYAELPFWEQMIYELPATILLGAGADVATLGIAAANIPRAAKLGAQITLMPFGLVTSPGSGLPPQAGKVGKVAEKVPLKGPTVPEVKPSFTATVQKIAKGEQLTDAENLMRRANPEAFDNALKELEVGGAAPPVKPPAEPPKVATGEIPPELPKKTPIEQLKQVKAEIDADVNIAKKKVADIKQPELVTQANDAQFARLALNDAKKLSEQADALIKRIEKGEQGLQEELNVLTDKLASVKDALRFETQDMAKVRTYLARYVRENVPLDERGKLLTSIAQAKTPSDIAPIVQRANEIADVAEIKGLKTDINKELARAKTRKDEGIVKGRFGGEAQAELDTIRANAKMKRDDALSKILDNQKAYDEGRMSYEDMVAQNDTLSVSGLDGMTRDELENTLNYINTLKAEGRAGRKVQLEAFKAEMDTARKDIINVVSGGKELEPGVTRELKGVSGFVAKVRRGQLALTDLLDVMSGTDKTSKPYSSALNKFVDDRVLKSYNLEQEGLVRTQKAVSENAHRIFGTKKTRDLNNILRKMSRDKTDLGTFTNAEGKSKKLTMTKAEMVDAYNLMQATENLPTFTDGNKFTDDMMNAIRNGLTPEEKSWADWQRTFLADYWQGINDVYEPLYGVNLGRNENYWPRMRDIERSDIPEHILVRDDLNHFASVRNNSLKARTNNKIPFKFADANTKFANHIQQMEHFKAWGLNMRDLRSVFMNNETRNAIRQFHGQEILSRVDDYINILARGGIEKAKRNFLLDKLRGHVAVAQLGLKPMIAVKQPLALLAFGTEMPYRDFATGLGDFISNPLGNYKTLYEKSSALRARYRAGQYERDISQFVGSGKDFVSGKGNWRDKALGLIQLGDQFGTVPGMWAKYQSALKAGMTDADAILEAEKLVNRTQNTSQLFTQSGIQHGGSWARLMTMFQDQPNKYFRLMDSHYRNVLNGREGVAKGATAMLTLWVVIPSLFQWMSDGFQLRKDRQLRAVALGPVNNLLVFGQLAQSALGWAQGEKYPYQVSPALEPIEEAKKLIGKVREMVADGQDPYKDIDMDDLIDAMESVAKGVGLGTGIPTPYLIQVERMLRGEESKEGERTRDWRELFFSRWALEEPKPTVFDKSANTTAQIGGLKEAIEADKLPEITTTSDAWKQYNETFKKTLPSDILKSKKFDESAKSYAEAKIAEGEYESYPNKPLYKIVDWIEQNEDLNYNIRQYSNDWQERQKIKSLSKLKEYDKEHPRAYMGNLTPDQLILLMKYESATEEERAQMREDNELLSQTPSIEWLKKNTDKNAYLSLYGQEKVYTKEAYDKAKNLAKQLGYPDSALPKSLNIPKGSEENYFKYMDSEKKSSYENKLMLTQDDKLREYLGEDKPKEPIKVLEIGAANQELIDKWDSWGDSKSKNYISDESRREQKRKDWEATPEGQKYVTAKRQMKAYEVGVGESKSEPSKEFVDLYVKMMSILDKPGVGINSAEFIRLRADNLEFNHWIQDKTSWGTAAKAEIPDDVIKTHAEYLESYADPDMETVDRKLIRVDNPGYDKWRTSIPKGQAGHLEPLDMSRVPIWRIDQEWKDKDTEFNAIKHINPTEQARLRLDFLDNPENRKYWDARLRREAYEKEFPENLIPDYVTFKQLSNVGNPEYPSFRDERYLRQKPELAAALAEDITKPIPSEQYDILNETMVEQDKEYNALDKVEQEEYLADPANLKYTNNRLRRTALKEFVPDDQVEKYVLWKNLPKGEDNKWEEEWFMDENPDFHEIVAKRLYGRKYDFIKMPTRVVWAKYLQYKDMSDRGKKNFRLEHFDLEEWGQLALGWKPLSSRVVSESLSPANQTFEELLARLRALRR